MSERTSYANGVPSWVDLASPDVRASVAFYGGLFGWSYTAAAGAPEDTGGYGMFSLRGSIVAGVGPLQNDTQPPVWNTYIAVDDADATAAATTEAGGQVAMAPTDVMDAGRIAFLIDPVGAMVGIWQAGRTIGAELVNEPGTFGWSELLTRDTASAAGFYATVFGWRPQRVEMGGVGYTVFDLDGGAIGGMATLGDDLPAEVPSHWLTYFVVADADATVAGALELGGSVSMPAFDADGIGRIAVLVDPNGSSFAIITLPAAAPG